MKNRKGKVIYCSRCEMWFDATKGWHAHPGPVPLCPACGAPLFEIERSAFDANNVARMAEVLTWEWPSGSFWSTKLMGKA
jgi:hypothetical protein